MGALSTVGFTICSLSSGYASAVPLKRALFFRLCDHPVLIDGGKMSFGLERTSGAKCFMISARAMHVEGCQDRRYWRWIPLSNSRFSEGVELLDACWLEIRGKIETGILSSYTTYKANLIYKLSEDWYGLQYPPQEYSITIGGQSVCNCLLRLQVGDITRRPSISNRWRWLRIQEEIEELRHVTLPKERGDGWMKIEMGEFYTGEGGEGIVEVKMMEVKGGHWKKGLIIQGIEIRPKG